METEFEGRLRRTAGQVNASDLVEVGKFRKGPMDDQLSNVEEVADLISQVEGVALSADLRRNFHRFVGFQLAWRGKGPRKAVAGEFCLAGISEAVMAGSPEWPVEQAKTDEERQAFASLRFFDSQPHGGTGTSTALCLVADAEPAEIWYYHMVQGFMRLDLDYGSYLDLLLRTKGLYYWQYLFAACEKASPELEAVLPALRAGLELLREAFPDDDLEDLMTRLIDRERHVRQTKD
jgi:hypothetical protein